MSRLQTRPPVARKGFSHQSKKDEQTKKLTTKPPLGEPEISSWIHRGCPAKTKNHAMCPSKTQKIEPSNCLAHCLGGCFRRRGFFRRASYGTKSPFDGKVKRSVKLINTSHDHQKKGAIFCSASCRKNKNNGKGAMLCLTGSRSYCFANCPRLGKSYGNGPRDHSFLTRTFVGLRSQRDPFPGGLGSGYPRKTLAIPLPTEGRVPKRVSGF